LDVVLELPLRIRNHVVDATEAIPGPLLYSLRMQLFTGIDPASDKRSSSSASLHP
jgi:hypothetical protein